MKGIVALAGACGICVVLAGCSKEPEQATQAVAGQSAAVAAIQGDVSSLGVDSATGAKAAECAVKYLARLATVGGPYANLPREQFALQQDPEHFVYWGKQNSDGSVYCPEMDPNGVLAKFTRENPFYVVNAAAMQRLANAAAFTPTPKGEFEKTADYEARIAAEKTAHDAKGGGGSLAASIEVAFGGILGVPRLRPQQLASDPEPITYDPDTETLSLVVVPGIVKKTQEGNMTREVPVFEIPVAVKVPPDVAQKFLEIVRSEGYAFVNPSLAMELRNGKLVVREYSLKGAPDGRLQRALDAAGIRLENIPTEYEIPFRFGG